MSSPPDAGVSQRSAVIRKWAIRLGIALLAFEIFYVIAANVFLQSGALFDLINKKPEKMNISWEPTVTYLPGVATVRNLELRSQTKKDQIYLHVVEAKARISLVKLLFKTIHIRGVDARDVDFRYRERLDRPPKPGAENEPRKEPVNVEFWPEIPGYSNPPDPKPEDLYPLKKKKRPSTIKITGAEVEGPVEVALNDVRIEGEGTVGGGVTVRPRKTITIHRGKLKLDPSTVAIGSDVLTRDLSIDADLRFETFPAKGSKFADILGGISGDLGLAGALGERAAVRYVITPGISVRGSGAIDAALKFKKGVFRAGSEYSLKSDVFHMMIMGLDVSGSATVTGGTVKQGGEHLTNAQIDFGDFQFVDPEDGSVDISGTGLELDAAWKGLSVGGYAPASSVDLIVPSAEINDVSAFNGLIPEQTAVRLESGTGRLEAKLQITERVAAGTLDLVAEEIVMESRDTPLSGDLEVHAKLTDGDLASKHFDFSGTTLRLDKIVGQGLSEKKQEKLDAWFCAAELERGEITFGKPMAVGGRVKIEMHDTRPVMALLKELGAGSKWLSLAPNIKDVEGTMDVDIEENYLAFDDLDMTGEGFEGLGWMHVDDRKTDGRIFVRFKAVMAGVSLDQSKAKIHLSKPRKWFEEQPKGPVPGPAPEAPPEN